MRKWAAILGLLGVLVAAKPICAAPYFFVSGPDKIYSGTYFRYTLFLDTDGQTLSAAQAVLSYNGEYIDGISIDARTSVCSFFTAPNPGLGFGNASTPYFYNDEKIVVACGFSNPGYQTESNNEFILNFYMTASPNATQSGIVRNDTWTFSNTVYYYAALNITPGASQNFNLLVYPSKMEALATPTPTPLTSADILKYSDMSFVEIGTTTSESYEGTGLRNMGWMPEFDSSQVQNVVEIDDTIPPPPADLEPRAPVTPPAIPPTLSPDVDLEGEVLSVKSLRELLLPGRSDADQTIVLINLATGLLFLVVTVFLVWRLVMISRKNKLRYRHLQDTLTGELAMLEGKMGNEGEEESEYKDQLERLRKELELN